MIDVNDFFNNKDVQKAINNEDVSLFIDECDEQNLDRDTIFKLIRFLLRNNIMSASWELRNFYVSTLFYHIENFTRGEYGVEFNPSTQVFTLSEPAPNYGTYKLSYNSAYYVDNVFKVSIICHLNDDKGLDDLIFHMRNNEYIHKYLKSELSRIEGLHL